MIRYAITDGTAHPTEHGELLSQVQRWAASRLDFIQLREKHLTNGCLLSLAQELMQHLHRIRMTGEAAPSTRLLLNGRLEIAVAAAADGVHLGSGAAWNAPAQVRQAYAEAGLQAPVLSISCHTLEEVHHARDAGVDMILFGPVFEKRVQGHLVRGGDGVERLQQACRSAGKTPLLALGGVHAENVTTCLGAGAAGVAAIRLFA